MLICMLGPPAASAAAETDVDAVIVSSSFDIERGNDGVVPNFVFPAAGDDDVVITAAAAALVDAFRSSHAVIRSTAAASAGSTAARR